MRNLHSTTSSRISPDSEKRATALPRPMSPPPKTLWELPVTSSHSPPQSNHRGSLLPLRLARQPPTSRSPRWLFRGLELSSPIG